MAQPVSSPITSTPAVPGQPYDAVDESTSTAPWVKLDGNAGPCDINTGRCSGEDFADSPPFRQV